MRDGTKLQATVELTQEALLDLQAQTVNKYGTHIHTTLDNYKKELTTNTNVAQHKWCVV